MSLQAKGKGRVLFYYLTPQVRVNLLVAHPPAERSRLIQIRLEAAIIDAYADKTHDFEITSGLGRTKDRGVLFLSPLASLR